MARLIYRAAREADLVQTAQVHQVALKAGFTLNGFFHFLTTAAFGRLGQYVAFGPLLF